MEGTGKGNPAGLSLSKGCFQHHQESRDALVFEDLTQYPQLRAPGVTVEHILPSTLSTSLTLESASVIYLISINVCSDLTAVEFSQKHV